MKGQNCKIEDGVVGGPSGAKTQRPKSLSRTRISLLCVRTFCRDAETSRTYQTYYLLQQIRIHFLYTYFLFEFYYTPKIQTQNITS